MVLKFSKYSYQKERAVCYAYCILDFFPFACLLKFFSLGTMSWSGIILLDLMVIFERRS